jgi:hypothetical protein
MVIPRKKEDDRKGYRRRWAAVGAIARASAINMDPNISGRASCNTFLMKAKASSRHVAGGTMLHPAFFRDLFKNLNAIWIGPQFATSHGAVAPSESRHQDCKPGKIRRALQFVTF